MKKIYFYSFIILALGSLLLLLSCNPGGGAAANLTDGKSSEVPFVKVEAEDFNLASQPFEELSCETGETCLNATNEGWAAFDIPIPAAGRYRSFIHLKVDTIADIVCWIEDYHDNPDNRTYNITGSMNVTGPTDGFITVGRDGSPLNAGIHRMKVHFDRGVHVDWIGFEMMRPHRETPRVMKQRMQGEEWKLVWSDEFEGTSLDTACWTYDLGDWGWGNNELQYYTENDTANARLENGTLIIEARKAGNATGWTSARLTTRGKLSFLYGKIEFRAKVPSGRGNWAAGWTLGDDYVDELSWPYCGEIDILESVGFEMDDRTGNGKAHASAHSGAYYFKLGNQPTGIIDVESMDRAFHRYAVEWTPQWIKAYVDDSLYITYHDTSTDLSWPFDRPQNIILNLAMGGGWGGAHGIDENLNSQKMIIDYVRVYERK